MACLDTDILIELLRGNREAIGFIQHLASREERICTTIFSEYELWAGVFLRWGHELDVLRLLSGLSVLNADRETAKTFGKLGAQLIRSGAQVPETDLMIASVAVKHGEALVTRNEKHFSRIPGLKVIRW